MWRLQGHEKGIRFGDCIGIMPGDSGGLASKLLKRVPMPHSLEVLTVAV